ncbi:MAG: hypothetical protein C4516_03190 [Oxalobacter sp.]|nr:MAG: hypothetical protein C4516_03190 [Oxalobacter sp.]
MGNVAQTPTKPLDIKHHCLKMTGFGNAFFVFLALFVAGRSGGLCFNTGSSFFALMMNLFK